MSAHTVKQDIHRGDFSDASVRAALKQDVLNLSLDTGVSQEDTFLRYHLFREYNKRCYVDALATSDMVSPYNNAFVPTRAAVAALITPSTGDSIIQVGGDNILLIGGDDMILI